MSEARERWLHGLAGEFVDRVRSISVRDLVAEDLAAAGGRDLTAATVLAAIARAHASGKLLEEIVAWLERAEVLVPAAEPLDVAMAAISVFRAGRLPVERWWTPAALHEGLLESWCYMALTRQDSDWVRGALQRRWDVDERAVDVWTRGRPDPLPIEEFAFQWEARDRQIAVLLHTSECERIVQSALRQLPAGA